MVPQQIVLTCEYVMVLVRGYNGAVMFNLEAAAVMERWLQRLSVLWIDLFFARSSRDWSRQLLDGEFADDAVLFAYSQDKAKGI